MTGVAQEAAAVGQHANEVAQQAQACQAGHLLFHADLVVIEPPCGADVYKRQPLDSTHPATRKGLLAPFRPQSCWAPYKKSKSLR